MTRGILAATAFLLHCGVSQQALAQAYQEAGQIGNVASWRTPEFNNEYGLGSMRAEYAYARGFTGKSVVMGAVDSGALVSHPEYANRFTFLTSSGTYSASGYKYITGGGVTSQTWTAGEPFNVPGGWNRTYNDDHGTHVVGTMGAARDGIQMHGVAFDGRVLVTNTFANDSAIYGANMDYNYFKQAYGNLAAGGARLINSSWGSPPPTENYNTLAGLTAGYRPFAGKLTWLDAVGEVARTGVIQVFAAGNAGVNNPTVRAALPYFRPELESYWVAATGINRTDGTIFNRCGVAKYWCIAGPGQTILSTVVNANTGAAGYGTKSGTSMSAPHVSGALAIIMDRFPYLSGEAARDIMLTTATHLGTGPVDQPNIVFGWGKPNLERAMDGPAQFLGQFQATLPTGIVDTWSNDISDVALRQRLIEDTAEHNGWVATKAANGWSNGLPASATADQAYAYLVGETRDQAFLSRQYVGGLTKSGEGTLRLTGQGTYTGQTLVNGGVLAVDGAITSATIVNAGGTLGGIGRVGSLRANAGGTVAPGSSIGTLSVTGNAAFGPGSFYAVELATDGRSDKLQVGGTASLGGTVRLSAENSAAPLSYGQMRALLGNSYAILTAAGGVSGTFEALPSFLFLGPSLAYGVNDVTLTIGRTARFASVGGTPNAAATGAGIETLGLGNSVFETILAGTSAAEVRAALNGLSGEVHASAVTAQFETAYFVREMILGRLRGGSGAMAIPGLGLGASLPAAFAADMPGRAAPPAPVPVAILDPNVFGLWGHGFGSWGSSRGDGNAASLTRDTAGFVIGADARLGDVFKLGIAGGYTSTNLDVTGRRSNGSIESGFGAIYGGAELGPVQVRAGFSYAGNDLDLRRTALGFGSLRAKYDGSTAQVFGELGYRIGFAGGHIEPFAGGAGIWIHSDGFVEAGGPAALRSRERSYDLGTSTVGVRGELALFAELPMTAHALLGWRHAFGNVTPAALLAFAAGGQDFRISGVPIDRDALVAEFGVNYRVSGALTIGLGYAGQVGDRAQEHSVRGNLTYRF